MSDPAQPAAPSPKPEGPAKPACPPHVLAAIYGSSEADKKAAYEESLRRCGAQLLRLRSAVRPPLGRGPRAHHEADGPGRCRWWAEYSDRKNDEEHEYVANSLLYDRNHLPRTAPAPDCVPPPERPPPPTRG